jgi:exodeoxyribonuclease V alpha subunit
MDSANPIDCLRWYALNATCERSGHVWLQDDRRRWEGPRPLYTEAEYDGKRYVSGRYGRMERRAAYCLQKLLYRDLPLVPYESLGISESTVDLGDSQIEALGGACGVPVSVITGGPGTGKTTIARILAKAHKRVLGLSPTGKGADCLAQSIGAECYTIHRAARQAMQKTLNLHDYDLILCDETGMLDTYVLDMLCTHLHNSETWARVVFLGDPGQLPSVGPGRVLDELISYLPTFKLDIVYRYSDANIGLACEYAGAGRLYTGHGAAYSFSEGNLGKVKEEYRRIVSLYGTGESRLITYHRGHAAMFNNDMKDAFRSKPPIVCLKNNYRHNIFNGQCGHANWVGGHQLTFGNKVLDRDDIMWTYGYGSTCHRAQGGQWNGVVVWIPSARFLTREWFKTACSRAVKNLSIVVRDAEVTERCLAHAKSAARRVSLLSGFLSGKAQWIQ